MSREFALTVWERGALFRHLAPKWIPSRNVAERPAGGPDEAPNLLKLTKQRSEAGSRMTALDEFREAVCRNTDRARWRFLRSGWFRSRSVDDPRPLE